MIFWWIISAIIIAGSAEIRLMDGLRASIENSLAVANSKGAVLKKYRHLKKTCVRTNKAYEFV
ncbi:hypothetical protein [Bathymodiolus platifrons methanotrophic gill symbiont]|uniref:hypothetical protein n=1 Tax=Bathymodiolus platifrons methanotrophic gill symbiont TaxID=113268 RepID=UPI000B40C54A|nr:hypothetical protein [Bathymodiolus platifrons methanotrophic gill symbiont]